jgi:putative phosphoribosyl transferase
LLDVLGHVELALGAIASGDVRVLNYDIIGWLNISNRMIDAVTARESQELQCRDRLYLGDRPPPKICDRLVILVDDGIATGAACGRPYPSLIPKSPQTDCSGSG